MTLFYGTIHQHPINDYRIDFYFPEYRLGVEFDEIYHNSDNQKLKDINRTEEINKTGIKILRINENLNELVNIFSELVKFKYEKN